MNIKELREKQMKEEEKEQKLQADVMKVFQSGNVRFSELQKPKKNIMIEMQERLDEGISDRDASDRRDILSLTPEQRKKLLLMYEQGLQ